MATISGTKSHELIDLYAKNIATAGNVMGYGDIYKHMLIPHQGNGKTNIHSIPRVKFKPGIRGTIKIFGKPEVMLWDDIQSLECICQITDEPKSLALLDAEDILYRTIMDDDCTWKQGQVAIWRNKYQKKGESGEL